MRPALRLLPRPEPAPAPDLGPRVAALRSRIRDLDEEAIGQLEWLVTAVERSHAAGEALAGCARVLLGADRT